MLLTGCASTGANIGDTLPAAWGGLPTDTPARPDNPGEYLAVHDVPRHKQDMLSDAEQKKLEAELVRARDRLGGEGGRKPVPTARTTKSQARTGQ